MQSHTIQDLPVVQTVMNLPVMQEIWVQSLGQEDPLEKWQPTPVFLPGKSHGQRSLAGFSPKGRKESDTAEQEAQRTSGKSSFWGTSHHAGPPAPHFTLHIAPLPAPLEVTKPFAVSVSVSNWLRYCCDVINSSVVREVIRYILRAAHCFGYNERKSFPYAFPYLAVNYLMLPGMTNHSHPRRKTTHKEISLCAGSLL